MPKMFKYKGGIVKQYKRSIRLICQICKRHYTCTKGSHAHEDRVCYSKNCSSSNPNQMDVFAKAG